MADTPRYVVVEWNNREGTGALEKRLNEHVTDELVVIVPAPNGVVAIFRASKPRSGKADFA